MRAERSPAAGCCSPPLGATPSRRTPTRCSVPSTQPDRSGELLRGLTAFPRAQRALGIRRPAALRVHRHTMRNRIDAVERLTGRRMDSAQDRHELWLALRGPRRRPDVVGPSLAGDTAGRADVGVMLSPWWSRAGRLRAAVALDEQSQPDAAHAGRGAPRRVLTVTARISAAISFFGEPGRIVVGRGGFGMVLRRSGAIYLRSRCCAGWGELVAAWCMWPSCLRSICCSHFISGTGSGAFAFLSWSPWRCSAGPCRGSPHAWSALAFLGGAPRSSGSRSPVPSTGVQRGLRDQVGFASCVLRLRPGCRRGIGTRCAKLRRARLAMEAEYDRLGRDCPPISCRSTIAQRLKDSVAQHHAEQVRRRLDPVRRPRRLYQARQRHLPERFGALPRPACTPTWTRWSTATAWRRSRPAGIPTWWSAACREPRDDRMEALACLRAGHGRQLSPDRKTRTGKEVPLRIGLAAGPDRRRASSARLDSSTTCGATPGQRRSRGLRQTGVEAGFEVPQRRRLRTAQPRVSAGGTRQGRRQGQGRRMPTTWYLVGRRDCRRRCAARSGTMSPRRTGAPGRPRWASAEFSAQRVTSSGRSSMLS